MEKYAGLIYFNDTPELLEKVMVALKQSDFKIIAVDGAFKEFPLSENEKTYSTDGCIDVAVHYADININAPTDGWVNQALKRNQYFKYAPNGSYVFSIDADELMQPFDWTGIELKEDVYRIKQLRFLENGEKVELGTVRGYKIYPDLEYRYRHCTIYRMKQHKEGDLTSGLVTRAKGPENPKRTMVRDKAGNFLMIHNRRDLRTPERRKQKEHYKKNRKEWDYRRQLNDF